MLGLAPALFCTLANLPMRADRVSFAAWKLSRSIAANGPASTLNRRYRDELSGMSANPAARPDGSENHHWTTPAAAAGVADSQLPSPQRARPDTSPLQIQQAIGQWADRLMGLAATLASGPKGRSGCATPGQANSVAGLTESTVRACALDLQRWAGIMELDRGQRDRLTPELRPAQRELHRSRQELLDRRIAGVHARQGVFQDALTGLPNRTSFEERARRALAWHESEARELGLLYIDLNEFKSINEHYGSSVGEELLRIIAGRLTAAVRQEDWVSRHGGTEFLCLLVEIQSERQLVSTAQRLYDAVAAPSQIGRLALSVTPSIGIALYPHHGTTLAALSASADAAVSWAKKHRLGHAFFQPVASR
jgi:diguanylate cyclase